MAVVVVVVIVIVIVIVIVMMLIKLCRIAALQAQQQSRWHLTALHRNHRNPRADQGAEALAKPIDLDRLKYISAAEQHQIRRFQLILEELFDVAEVIKVGISLALGLQGCRITHHAASGQGFAIHHGHHPAHSGTGANLGPAKGLHQRHRQSKSAGFHHDAVKLISPLKQGLHGGQKFILHGAAEAAVGQFHDAALKLLLGTEPAAANQVAIDADLAEFVDQHRQAQPAVA